MYFKTDNKKAHLLRSQVYTNIKVHFNKNKVLTDPCFTLHNNVKVNNDIIKTTFNMLLYMLHAINTTGKLNNQ